MIRLRNLIPGNLLGFCLLAVLALAGNAFAFGPATRASVDATQSPNTTFCQFWVDKVVPLMKTDETQTFLVASADQITAQGPQIFEPSVVGNFNKIFTDTSTMNQLLTSLQGKSATPGTFAGVIAQQIQDNNQAASSSVGLDGAKASPFVGILSGAGVHVGWGTGSHTIQFGYKFDDTTDPTSQAKDVKSGRGFGAVVDPNEDAQASQEVQDIAGAPSAGSQEWQLFLDASDMRLMTDAQNYFSDPSVDIGLWYQTLFEILTRNDYSGLAKLDVAGRRLMVNVITVTGAELSRADMTGINPAQTDFISHPWEKDLLAVIILAPFVTASGQQLSKFYAIGQSGSGLGETRHPRVALQEGITKSLNQNAAGNQSIVQRLSTAMGRPGAGSDVVQTSLDYLFPVTATGDRAVVANSANIVPLLVDLIKATRANDIVADSGLQGLLTSVSGGKTAAPKQVSATSAPNQSAISAAPPVKVSPRAHFNQGPTSADQARARFASRKATPRTMPRSSTNGN